MFSFGPIKTATALGGALLCVRDRDVLARMRKRQASYPIQQRGAFVKRALKYALMKLMSYGPLFGGLVWTMRILGRDPNELITSWVRGFPGPQLLPMIRRQPSAPLLALMHRRIAFFSRHSLQRRTASGQDLMSLIGGAAPSPGAGSEIHSFWVFPVVHDDPEQFISYLWRGGFDASRAHSLFVVPPHADRPTMHAAMAEEMLPLIVHLPCYAEMPRHELRRLAHKVRLAARTLPRAASHPATPSRARIPSIH
jgi:dTDP-4-amino-4,6-dideoxygalactose transaminase